MHSLQRSSRDPRAALRLTLAWALIGALGCDNGETAPAADAALSADAELRCFEDRFGETSEQAPAALTTGRLEGARLCPELPVDVFSVSGEPGDLIEITLLADGGQIRSRGLIAGPETPLTVEVPEGAGGITLSVSEDALPAEGRAYELLVGRVPVSARCLPDALAGAPSPEVSPGYRGRLSVCAGERDVVRIPGEAEAILVVSVEHLRGGALRLSADAGLQMERLVLPGDVATFEADVPEGEALEVEISPLASDVLEYELLVSTRPRPEVTAEWAFAGHLMMVDRPVDAEGLGAPRSLPAAGLLVDAIDLDSGEVLAQGEVGDDGAFELRWQGPLEGRAGLRLLAAAEVDGTAVRVVAEGVEAPWALVVASAEAPGAHMVEHTLSIEEPLTPAFHVLATAGAALRATAPHRRDIPATPPLVIRWRPGEAAACGTCFSPGDIPIIELGGAPRDPDEWDDAVIRHEVGHYVAEIYGRDDSPGGAHDGTPTIPALAWSEGWAHFHAAWVAGEPTLLDLKATGVSVVSLEQMGDDRAVGTEGGVVEGRVSEWLVAAVLWDLYDEGEELADEDTVSIGGGPLLASLFGVLPTSMSDRGAGGVDLVDHLDAIACLEGSLEGWVPLLRARDYPYVFDEAVCDAFEKASPPIDVTSTAKGWRLVARRAGWLRLEGASTSLVRYVEIGEGIEAPKAGAEGWLHVQLDTVGQRAVMSIPTSGAHWSSRPRVRRGGAVELPRWPMAR